MDGLRAICAILVVFFHNGAPPFLQGWIGVRSLLRPPRVSDHDLAAAREERAGRVSFKNLYTRRAFRILPVYVVVLLLTAGVLLVTGQFFTNELGSNSPST
ncbi:MAG: acyltransferase family protein, partial [Actinomycetota bacterium]